MNTPAPRFFDLNLNVAVVVAVVVVWVNVGVVVLNLVASTALQGGHA